LGFNTKLGGTTGQELRESIRERKRGRWYAKNARVVLKPTRGGLSEHAAQKTRKYPVFRKDGEWKEIFLGN